MSDRHTDGKEGLQKLKQALVEINKWEYKEILNSIKDVHIDVTPGYHKKTLQDCFEAMERNSKDKEP